MWVWSKSGCLVNMAHIAQIGIEDNGVLAWGVGSLCPAYELFEGTDAECKAYLEQLDLDLAEQGDRVAVALEKIAKQGAPLDYQEQVAAAEKLLGLD